MNANAAEGGAPTHQDLLEMTAEVAAAYVSNNVVPSDELPELISRIHAALASAGTAVEEPEPENQKPAVSIRRSITPDYLICLEDGKKLKMLKRYLRTNFDMSPEEYRAKWNLPSDYPMVAPNYAKKRAEMAKAIGLGRGGRRRAKA
ncbi:MucR family transcriptional regulator [Minwuia thermotolerans]|jgi:predicted transcriptional regulator|uniref:MucR family transcriptional regulator n=1 Tax=Minwuia thermotolerans TaxID=2056226 RepID=A0A2M9FXE1_9PROT|nr:MucR family transcriptional regulator [Minwuia thermotolerans]ANK81738.1 MAG: MucR family transcriptional regulator [Rhizobiales bacterium NRL2]PJK28126.1 MucR family transcriptional regulator [Minwuia thermotolerans]